MAGLRSDAANLSKFSASSGAKCETLHQQTDDSARVSRRSSEPYLSDGQNLSTSYTCCGHVEPDVGDKEDRESLAKFSASDFDPLQLLRDFTFESVPLTDQIFADVASYLNMVFCGAPIALTTEDLKHAKEYHPYVEDNSKQWWDAYRVERWCRTIRSTSGHGLSCLNSVSNDDSCVIEQYLPSGKSSHRGLWGLIMASTSTSEGFNEVIQHLSTARYADSWFARDYYSFYRDRVRTRKNASSVELHQLKNACLILSGNKSFESVKNQLKREYILAMSDRALSSKTTSISDDVISQVIEKPSYFRFLNLPPEIREKVLDLLLVTKLKSHWQHEAYNDHFLFGEDACWPEDSPRSDSCPSQIFPEVLRTCKQLSQEALPILYRKNNFKLCSYRMPMYSEYEQFSEEFLSNIGRHNLALIEKLWLPGDAAVFPNTDLHPQEKTHMCLTRLLEKHSCLSHLQLLVFQVYLFEHSQGEPSKLHRSLNRDFFYSKIHQEHLDLLGLRKKWGDAVYQLKHVLRTDAEEATVCLQLKKMAQQVNRSIFTSMALRVATLFRAKCQDSVLLYEAGKPAKRELILSRKALTTQYGELPTRVESPWSDDFAPKEKIGPLPLRVDIRRGYVHRTLPGYNVIVD